MKLTPLPLQGAFVLDSDPIHDERGYFLRTYCAESLAEHGITARFVQCSISSNRLSGTLRGLHYQDEPHGEDKLVRCIRGAVQDVLVDLRPLSNTFGQWVAVDLTERNSRAVYIPKGFAHGFQALEDDTELLYQISAGYQPGFARGIRYDDPSLAIPWPLPVTSISARDAALPLMSEVFSIISKEKSEPKGVHA